MKTLRAIIMLAVLLAALPLHADKRKDTRTRVLIETTAGNITLALYDETPMHRDNFIKLVKEGFYDGLLFHRTIEGFMIQSGDPDSRNAPKGKQLGEGGPGYTLSAEILYPQFYHKRGALAAAREGDDERIAECLKTLRAQLGRSADMIERVRSYAKRRDGRENPVDLKKVAREVVNEVGQSKSSRTAVTLELPEEETVVEGNGLELFLLLLNLLKNAQRATEEAKASSPVRVRLIRTSEKIRLTVENDGRPLSEEEVAKLGTPFSTTSEDGLGLGLVIVQSIAEAHRAKLLYRAREAGGLSVSLDFPPFARSAPETEPSEGHEE